MQEALEERGGPFVADAQAAEVLETWDGAFDRPVSLVSAQSSAILREVLQPSFAPFWRDHLDALIIKFLVELMGVVGIFPMTLLGRFAESMKSKRPCAGRAGSERVSPDLA